MLSRVGNIQYTLRHSQTHTRNTLYVVLNAKLNSISVCFKASALEEGK